jgi:hypothetical protein
VLDLSRRQLFIEVLVLTGSVVQAAREAGIARSTAYAWFHADPSLREEVNARRGQLAALRVAQLRAAGPVAVEVLLGALGSPRPADRIKAAVALLNAGHRDATVTDALEEVRDALREFRGERQPQPPDGLPQGPGGVPAAPPGPEPGA